MNRQEQLSRLSKVKEYDIVIIGGGATGLGCAVDAANRGYQTLLLEKSDFAKGTSSRSTKLLHGGVRYLAQGNVRLVKEALLERGRLLKNAPHLCHKMSFVVPSYKWWHKWFYGIGLWIYEFLSGKLSLGKTKLLTRKRTQKYLPDLLVHSMNGGILYFDGQFDDSRLAVNLAQTAIEQGATVLNYCSVTGFLKNGSVIAGVMAKDEIGGTGIEIRAKVVVNATGVFADQLLQLAEGHSEETIAPSQGIHLVVDKHFFRGNAGMMLPKTDDGRVLFFIPWEGKVVLGTTDTPVDTITEEPLPLKEEIDFIINHFNRFSATHINYGDVKSVYAGLRPLAKVGDRKKTAVMPRDHVIKVMPSGLVHVTGGKWTTYRNMAKLAIDKAVQISGLEFRPCRTRKLKIHGWTKNCKNELLSLYGADAVTIKQMIAQDESLSEKIHASYPYMKGEIKWVIENEMAETIEDVLARRIRLLFLDAKAAMEAAPMVADMFAILKGKDKKWQKQQIEMFNKLAEGYLIHLDLPGKMKE